MKHAWWLGGFLLSVGMGLAAERAFDFSTNALGAAPAGFISFVAGGGPPGDWQVVMAEVPSQFEPLLKDKPEVNKLPVLSQLSHDSTDERYPVLYYPEERYGDFTFSTRFRLVDGDREQMAGVVFRLQDERNFYVVRASARGNIRFYKFVDGQRSAPIGNEVPVKKGRWYGLTVQATANRIEVLLDGESVIPTLTDNSFPVGRVGFITKSDSVSEFMDAKVTYQPLVTVAEKLVRDTLERQPRLLNLRLYGKTSGRPELHVLAAKDPEELGQVASEVENRVFTGNETFFGKNEREFLVTSPLRDRNGEVVAVVKFFLKPFAGQTEANAVARVLPTVRWMEMRLAASESLTD